MNKIFSIVRANILITLSLAIWGMSAGFLSSCSEDDVPASFYSSTKMTAAEFIQSRDAQLSHFRTILTRSNYMSMLATYGHYTVFAPNNDAINAYLAENGYGSVDELPLSTCDTLARSHIVKSKAMFTTDIGSEGMPMNMNDRSLELSTDSDVTNNNAMMIFVNKQSRIVEKDDSVTNGVLHIINRVIVPNNQLMAGLLAADTTLTLFYKAMHLTGIDNLLTSYEDDSYRCSDDSVTKGVLVNFGTDSEGGAKRQNAKFPEHRRFLFTAFVETNAVFKAAGIETLTDLKNYAKMIYDEAYPEDAGKYDSLWTDRRNPLNRFISYHFIDRDGLYEDWVPCQGEIYKNYLIDLADAEDYYETMMPHSIMRFCYASDDLWINRKGLKNKVIDGCRGVKVLKRDPNGPTQECKNGRYHYIDRVLTYDYKTRNTALACRMRIDGTTMSPDFMNAHARMHHMGDDSFMMGFKKGYVTNFKMNNDKTFVGVRPEIAYWWHYQGNAVAITGAYDVSIKLPPVPFTSTWEIRLGYSTGPDRGVAQVYLNNEPCGIPVDFRVGDEGWEPDDMNDPEQMKAIDKAMRNRDFMKAMDSYGGDDPFRGRGLPRRILWRGAMEADKDYWLRFRQILDDEKLYMSLDYIEIVPKIVYDNPEGEDRH